MVLAPPATSRALFRGFTIHPLGDRPLLAFPASEAPPGLLAALQAFFPVEAASLGDRPEEGGAPEPQVDDSHLGPELYVDEEDKYLLIFVPHLDQERPALGEWGGWPTPAGWRARRGGRGADPSPTGAPAEGPP